MPALAAGVVIGRPEATTGMVPGVPTKPVPQCGVWIAWCRRGGFVTLGGAMLPGDAAGESLADPQYQLEVANGGPPPFRA
jgi:hypothetical protein